MPTAVGTLCRNTWPAHPGRGSGDCSLLGVRPQGGNAALGYAAPAYSLGGQPNHQVVAHTTAAAPSLRKEVEVSVDNETSNCHSMMTLRCRDRKGLLYDLFRSLKDIDLR